MAGFAVPLRSDPSFLRSHLQAGWIHEETGGPAQAATLQAKRLDDQEAPQRDAARLAREEDAAKTKLEKAKLVNKPKFRP